MKTLRSVLGAFAPRANKTDAAQEAAADTPVSAEASAPRMQTYPK